MMLLRSHQSLGMYSEFLLYILKTTSFLQDPVSFGKYLNPNLLINQDSQLPSFLGISFKVILRYLAFI